LSLRDALPSSWEQIHRWGEKHSTSSGKLKTTKANLDDCQFESHLHCGVWANASSLLRRALSSFQRRAHVPRSHETFSELGRQCSGSPAYGLSARASSPTLPA